MDTLGWQGTSGGQSTSTVVSRVLSTLRPGELRARGYSFVTIAQFL